MPTPFTMTAPNPKHANAPSLLELMFNRTAQPATVPTLSREEMTQYLEQRREFEKTLVRDVGSSIGGKALWCEAPNAK